MVEKKDGKPKLVKRAGKPQGSKKPKYSEQSKKYQIKRRWTAKYKGRQYVLVWIGDTKYGQRARLCTANGVLDFWVDADKIDELSNGSKVLTVYLSKPAPKNEDFVDSYLNNEQQEDEEEEEAAADTEEQDSYLDEEEGDEEESDDSDDDDNEEGDEEDDDDVPF
jgi:hypothetical protein